MDRPQIEQLISKYKIFQEKLLQTNAKNRCIFLSRIYKKHTFDLSTLEKIDTDLVEKITERVLKTKKPICILPDSDDSEDAESMRSNLYALSKNLKQIEDETGTQYGYFAYPFLEGHVSETFYIRAPLVLFPISLEYKRNGRPSGWYINFSDSLPIFNHTLLVALKEKAGLQISDDLEISFQDFIGDLKSDTENLESKFFQNLEELLLGLGCKINKKPDDNQIKNLSALGKEDIEKIEQQPLCIINYKIIGNFPQGDSKIYEDYNELIEKAKDEDTHKVINELLEIEREGTTLESHVQIDPENPPDSYLHTVLDSDSSQDKTVLSSQDNHYTVVRGPPGTGKSQVIVNIISNALSKGQKILVICQKRVALEVVHQRLSKVKLDKYSILLDKEKDDRAKIYRQLQQIIQRGNSDYHGTTNVEIISKQIDDIVQKQSSIANALTKDFGGITIQKLYLRAETNYKPALEISSLVDKIEFPSLEQFLSKIEDVEEGYKLFEVQNHPWYHRIDFSVISSLSKNMIENILKNIIKLSQESLVASSRQKQDLLLSLMKEYFTLSSTLDTLSADVSGIRNNLSNFLPNSNLSEILLDYNNSLERINLGQNLWKEFKSHERINEIIDEPYLERSQYEQQKIFDSINKYRKNNSFFKKILSSEVRQAEQVVKIILEKPQNHSKGIDDVAKKAENGLLLWTCFKSIETIRRAISDSITLSSQSGQVQLIENMVKYKTKTDNISDCKKRMSELLDNVKNIFCESKLDFQEIKLKEYSQFGEKGLLVFDNLENLYAFLNEQGRCQLDEIKSQPNELRDKAESMLKYLEYFEKIQDHDLRKKELSQEHITILYQCSKKFDSNIIWKDAVRQELFYAWINNIEAKYPILRTYHFENHASFQSQLNELIIKKKEAVINKIVNKIQSSVTTGEKYSRNKTDRQSRTAYLEHELGKKRKVMPVRRLLQEYGDIILDISPCWLASPDIVSNIFPLKKDIFDLIIVDEASQLATERSLPFLFRGKKIVIAGDEKQLKPFDLFKFNEVDEDEEDETLNIESLLVLAARANPEKNDLKWHYRSKWQELIDFSNHAFYQGNLHIFPNIVREHDIAPIRWIKCDGIWEERSNVIEAEKIIELIHAHMNEYKNNEEFSTLGIITFNEKQRDEIQKRIDDKRKMDPEFDKLATKFFDLPKERKDKEIFIKNIENVQGDERDKIIFSVGYAKDKDGNKVRVQFGSLNKEGGENRLNVAVTRAREETIIVSSIEPGEIPLDTVKSIGPKRLKDFLQYAKQVNEGQKEQIKQLLTGLLPSGSNQNSSIRPHDDEFEQMVAQKIKSKGYEVVPYYGSSEYHIDLAVVNPRDPKRFILGIECDGKSLLVMKSIRDRDVMIPNFLKKRGWELYRTWSRTWWQNPEAELGRIISKIENLSTTKTATEQK